MDFLEETLCKYGLRSTPVRELIYSVIANADTAYSLMELETELETVDKSSISRNLRLFLELGLIHQIQDDSGIAKYALSQNSDGMHLQNHAHFYCLKCEKTICLDQLTLDLSTITLPEGYTTDNYSLLLKGLCPDCH